jgi:hypothetical protein
LAPTPLLAGSGSLYGDCVRSDSSEVHQSGTAARWPYEAFRSGDPALAWNGHAIEVVELAPAGAALRNFLQEVS